MKPSEAQQELTFDDVLLVPNHSEVLSRSAPDITTQNKNFPFAIPIFSAPMSTVTEIEMATEMHRLGGGAVLHRYMSLERQIDMSLDLIQQRIDNFFVAVGSESDARERMPALYDTGVRHICIDVANGHNMHCWRTVEYIKTVFPDISVMAGNVCTLEGARTLAESGASLLRIGIGCGSVCITRIVTGHGRPQLSAIEDCVCLKDNPAHKDIVIIADGGIRNSGDIVKALAAGADMVMIGSLLAGAKETPGRIIEEDNRLYKYYSGMASEQARDNWFDKSKAGLPVEGVSTKIPYTGKLACNIIKGLCQSIKVGLAYAGANDISQLRAVAKWTRITPAGYIEGTPHQKGK